MNRRQMLLLTQKIGYAHKIYPTLGVEKIADPGLEATYTAGLCATLTAAGSATLAQSADFHGGAKAQSMTPTVVNDRIYWQASTVAGWWSAEIWAKVVGGTSAPTFRINFGTYDINKVITGAATYKKMIITGRATTGGVLLLQLREGDTDDFSQVITDDWSLKPITFASCLKTVKITTNGDVNISQKIAVESETQIGFCFNLDSPTNPANFMLLYSTGTKVYLDKCVAGVYTNIATITQAWSSGDTLEIVKSGTTYDVYRTAIATGTRAQIGTSYTVDEATIKDNIFHMQFSTYGGSTFLSPFFVGKPVVKLYSFAFTSDLHVGNEIGGWSAGLLDGMVGAIETATPSFVLVLGDIVDHGYVNDDAEEVPIYTTAMGALTMPYYTMRGNHDAGITTFDLERVIDVEAIGLRIICFSGSPLSIAAPNDNTGQLSEANLTWIETQLQGAAGKTCILACHYPLSTDIWGYIPSGYGREGLIELCSTYGVNVYISGHAHSNTVAGEYVVDGHIRNLHGNGTIFSSDLRYFMFDIYSNGSIIVNGYKYTSPFVSEVTIVSHL